MKIVNRQIRTKIMTIFAVFAVAAMTIGNVTPVRAAGTYKVSFKAGAKGTINGNTSLVVEDVPYKGSVNVDLYETSVQPEAGYYFTGWSPEAAGNVEITKKTTFVAQYARIIEEAVYRVNYVDTYGNAVATQKVATTNDGAKVSETAVPVNNFAVDAAVKTITASKDAAVEITFVYTSLAEANTVTETETVILPGGTTVTVVGGGTGAAATAGTGAAATAGTTAAAGTQGQNTEGTPTAEPEPEIVQNPDEETPLANQEVSDKDTATKKVEDEEVPLANEQASSHVWGYAIAGVLLLAAAAVAVVIYLSKRHKDGRNVK